MVAWCEGPSNQKNWGHIQETMNYLYQMTHRENTSSDGWDMKHILERIFYVELIEKKSSMLNRRTVTFTNYQVI